jgi:hypothetical protein
LLTCLKRLLAFCEAGAVSAKRRRPDQKNSQITSSNRKEAGQWTEETNINSYINKEIIQPKPCLVVLWRLRRRIPFIEQNPVPSSSQKHYVCDVKTVP